MVADDARYLSQNDSIMWMVEADPLLRSTILGLVVLDRVPEWDALRERMERVTHQVPALRQKIVTPPLHPKTLRWVVDPEFDLDQHLRRVALPAAGSMEDLLDLARTTAQHDFDRTRPLWQFTLVEGLDGDGAALMLKAHHVLTDGIGSVQLAAYLFDFELDADSPDAGGPSAADAAPLPTLDLLRDVVEHDVAGAVELGRRAARSALPAMLDAVRHPQATASGVVETAKSIGRMVAPVRERLSPVMTERRRSSHFATLEIPLADLRAAAKAAGATINDGFLAGITGGLRLYHEHHEAEVDDLRVAMPISLRTDGDAAGGNHVTVMRFVVPIGIADPAERIQALHEVASQIRDERSIDYVEPVAGALNLLPTGVIGAMLKRVDFLASNVPGIPVPMYLVGAEVSRFYPFGPTAGSSVNLTLMSYRDICCIGVNTDRAAIPDHDVFLDCIEAGFDEVVALADR
jgi:diacylglycerol O-acyltransferase